MRSLFFAVVFLALSQSSFAAITINADVKATPAFKKKFEEFWSAYTKQDAKKMYSMEAPHFRYIYDFKGYQAYVNMIKQPKNVILKEVKEEGDYLTGKILLDINDQTVYNEDRWIKLGNKYYHHTQFFLIYSE